VTDIMPGKKKLDILRASAYLFVRFSVEVPGFDQDNDFDGDTPITETRAGTHSSNCLNHNCSTSKGG